MLPAQNVMRRYKVEVVRVIQSNHKLATLVSMLCFLTKREGGTCIYSAPKQESKTFDKLHIVKPFYCSICTYNSINHRNLHVKGLRCEFQLLYILAILKKCCCDVTDNI